MNRLILSLILLYPALATPASTGERPPKNTDVSGLVLPSQTCQGMFIVPLTVGHGKGTTLDLMLDTGSTETFIDPGVVTRLFGPKSKPNKVLFRNGRIGQHETGRIRAYVHTMASLSLALGRKIDGILGFPAFQDVLLTIDYPAEEIRITSGILPLPDGREIFRFSGYNRPYLKIDIGGLRVEILLDSGSTGSFSLRSTKRLNWVVEPRPVIGLLRFTGITLDKVGRLGNPLQFGPLSFEAPIVILSRDEAVVGWEVLRHFVLTFDQKKKRIRMQPNGTTPVRMASMVGSGLVLNPLPEGMEIIKVFPGTSAEAAGLREGDLIITTDGTPVHELGCRDPQGPPAGQRNLWTFIRDGVQAEAEFETEILIP